MSQQITTAFIRQYKQGIQLLAQQKVSKFESCVMVDMQDAEFAFHDQIGPTTARKRTTRHGDTPLIETEHQRRRITTYTYEWADLIDDADKIRLLNDPTSAYSQNAVAAMNRAKDDEIIAAFFGDAYSDKDGGTTVTYPTSASYVVPVNLSGSNEGLTVNKLIRAKQLLLSFDIDETEELYIACAPKQLEDMLKTTQVTSTDYNSVKALVEGKIDTFMGFKFKVSTRLLTDANSYRRLPVWAKSGVKLAKGKDIKARIDERADKSYSTQVYCSLDCGATRLEEKKVIEVKCLES